MEVDFQWNLSGRYWLGDVLALSSEISRYLHRLLVYMGAHILNYSAYNYDRNTAIGCLWGRNGVQTSPEVQVFSTKIQEFPSEEWQCDYQKCCKQEVNGIKEH